MQRNNAAKACKVLGVWEGEAVHVRGSYWLLSTPLSGTLPSRDVSLSTREQRGTGSPVFYVFHVGIRTTIWDALLHKYTDLQRPLPRSPPLLMLSFWYLSAEAGAARARTVVIDFRVCVVTFSPAVHCERWERCTLTVSDLAWEHNHFWLAGGIAGAGFRSLLSLPRRYHGAIFDPSFAYRQHGACISQCKAQRNEHSDKGAREKKSLPASRHVA